MLTRAQILGADDLATAEVDVPEWGGSVRVRVMTGRQRELYEKHVIEKRPGVVPLLVSLAACDEGGNLLFTPEDVDRLADRSMKALFRVHEAARELNRLSIDDVAAAEGESGATQSNISATGSPNGSA